ncbi:MAG TPA: alpha/beta fold hydrolase [Micromonosporaceae bacterium]|nr:alpha/beta fold hydrolase [Micromonosporaceae bacterium]
MHDVMNRRIPHIAAALAFALFAATACSDDATSTAAPQTSEPAQTLAPAPIPSKTPGVACLTPDEQTGVIRFKSDNGASIAAVVLGKPTDVGVVLAHQNSGDMCEWVPYGRTLVGLGYAVMAIDLNGFGASSAADESPSRPQWDRDIVAAASELQDMGAQKIVLAGASLGGMAAVVAAADMDPAPAAVIDLSGPDEFSGLNAVTAAAKVTAPVLFVGGSGDQYTAQTRKVSQAATGAKENRMEVIQGSASHGVSLLKAETEPKAGQVATLIQDFIRRHTSG